VSVSIGLFVTAMANCNDVRYVHVGIIMLELRKCVKKHLFLCSPKIHCFSRLKLQQRTNVQEFHNFSEKANKVYP